MLDKTIQNHEKKVWPIMLKTEMGRKSLIKTALKSTVFLRGLLKRGTENGTESGTEIGKYHITFIAFKGYRLTRNDLLCIVFSYLINDFQHVTVLLIFLWMSIKYNFNSWVRKKNHMYTIANCVILTWLNE